jgi:hypothetical protein
MYIPCGVTSQDENEKKMATMLAGGRRRGRTILPTARHAEVAVQTAHKQLDGWFSWFFTLEGAISDLADLRKGGLSKVRRMLTPRYGEGKIAVATKIHCKAETSWRGAN